MVFEIILSRFDQEYVVFISPNTVRLHMDNKIIPRLIDHPSVKIIDNDKWCRWTYDDEEVIKHRY